MICTISYVPPKTYGNPTAFLENLAMHPTAYPLLLVSDWDWAGFIAERFTKYPAGNVKFIRLRNSPETVRDMVHPDDPNRRWIVNNAIFLTCLGTVAREQFSHFIYLEEDCRVGRERWDEIVYEEFFGFGKPLICGGSMVVFNPTNAGAKAHRRWAECVSKNIRQNFPIPTYGFKGSDAEHPSCVFVNGALGVYDTYWLVQLLKYILIKDTQIDFSKLRGAWAWDFYLGEKIWETCKEQSYDFIEHMGSVFSSYGNVLTKEAERLEMLRSGKVVGIHQVKSNTII